MADQQVTRAARPAPAPASRRWPEPVVAFRGAPWWVQVLVVFVASRIVTTVIMLVFAAMQGPTPWDGAHPGYFSYANFWDAGWYQRILTEGYPAHLPRDAGGTITESAWAFLPAYPYLVGLLMKITGIPFLVLAPIVTTLFSLAASLMFFRLMRRRLPEGTALFATVLLLVFPTSPVLQVAYAESMQLFLLFGALILLLDRRYYLLIPVVVLMSFTRPSGLAFALLLLLHLGYRFVVRRRDPFPWRQRVAVVVAGLACAVSGFAWSWIAGWVTGVPSAYTDTELVWRAGYTGGGALIPVKPWVQAGEYYLQQLGAPRLLALVATTLLLLALAAVLAVFLLGRAGRRLGVDLRLWLASYAAYLLAVFFPQSSIFRLLMPMAPALGAIALPRSRVYRVALVLAAVIGQVLWVWLCWQRFGDADLTPP